MKKKKEYIDSCFCALNNFIVLEAIPYKNKKKDDYRKSLYKVRDLLEELKEKVIPN